MNFCILIELSKERISFLYNRSDSDNGFVPFVEQGSLPLAIYCCGNQMEVGQFAVDEANKQNPNAFVDVFKKLRDGGTFRYRGEEIPNNMLLFNAIQRYLSSFFDSTLIGQMGRLEQNIATMPICFLFNADINENERLFVKDSFVKSGFANVGVRDCDQLAMRTVRTDSTNYVCVTSNGQDLFVNIYNKQGKPLDALLIRYHGRDPRMDVAVEKLWDSIGYDNYYLNKEQEKSMLEQVAENFLGSGKYSFNESVTFSNGYSYNVALSLHELEQISIKDDGKAIIDVMRKLADHNIKTSDCTVILQGKAAHNSFFSKMFKKEFNIVRSIDNSFRSEILANFLQEVKNAHYKFVDKIVAPPSSGTVKGSSPQPTNAPEPTVSPSRDSENPERKEPTPPTKRDERDMRMLRLSVETCLANLKIEQAYKDIADFTSRMHAKNVQAFNEELETLLAKTSDLRSQNGVNKASTNIFIPHSQPTKRDERDMKMLRMEVATCVNNGETRKIKTIVNYFREKMHAANIYAFDEELISLETQGQNPNISAGKSKVKTKTSTTSAEGKTTSHVPTKTATQGCDQGTALMRNEKFEEARDWFRANNKRTNADDCTTIIRWLRFLPAYESELQSTIAAKNKEKARARVKEIREIIDLYKKYGVDTSRLTKLSDEYKHIK